MNMQTPAMGYLQNAAQLDLFGGVFVGTIQMVVVLVVGFVAIAWLRSRRDP